MKRVDVVIGANYGDEGKGNVTNYLATRDSAVVRFNGGAQAAHTVEHDGTRHVFHSMGSGTLKGSATIFGPKFAIDPIMFMSEADDLATKTEFKLNVFADPRCPIITPYDVMINRALERKRGNKRHGSCGMGFGETIRRNKNACSFVLAHHDDARLRLADVERYAKHRMAEFDLEPDPDFHLQKALSLFLQELSSFVKHVQIVPFHEVEQQFDHIVFEGAQGLCLDQDSEDFPHVTYSHTGLKNVVELLRPSVHVPNVHYVTRTYLTRHGAGNLIGEHAKPACVVDETNAPNEFQGSLRFAPLNHTRMRSDIRRDLSKLNDFYYKAKLMITCCDQIEPDFLLMGHVLPHYETCWSAKGEWRVPEDQEAHA